MKTDQQSRRPCRILLAVTGSVAGIKGPEIAVSLVQNLNAEVKVLLTKGGQNFWEKAQTYNPSKWNEMKQRLENNQDIPNENSTIRKNEIGSINIIGPDDEWKEWSELGDPVLHIDLRDWADILLIAPLSAHSLAKLANGLCDDTLSCVVRAWDFGHGIRCGKPILIAPAMNTAMYNHPLTAKHMETIQGFWNTQKSPQGVAIIAPQVKTLACGEVGNGALASVNQILQATTSILKENTSYFKLERNLKKE